MHRKMILEIDVPGVLEGQGLRRRMAAEVNAFVGSKAEVEGVPVRWCLFSLSGSWEKMGSEV